MVPLGKDGTQCGNMLPTRPPQTPHKEPILGMWCSKAKCMPSDVHTLVYSHMMMRRHICKADIHNVVSPIFTRYTCPQAASNAAAGKISPQALRPARVLFSTARIIFSLNHPNKSSLHQQRSHSATLVSISVETTDSLMRSVFSPLFLHLT